MKQSQLPSEYTRLTITYKDGSYVREGLGFFNGRHFVVPHGYRRFMGSLLPHGWGGLRMTSDKVIRWEYHEDDEEQA